MRKAKKHPLQAKVESRLKIKFKKFGLLEAALTHPSYRFEHPNPAWENFDRLEFFGDTILNYVICRRLYSQFPKEDEGGMSRLRSTLVSRRILSRIARKLGFLGWVRIGKSLRDQGNYNKDKILADTFEAFIAALYFDRGLKQTESFLLTHFKDYFDIKRLFRLDPNPKSTLQELSQRKWHRLPIYTSTTGPKNMIKTVVEVTPRQKASAFGKTRKDSEEKAARLLVRKLQ